jgi:hypothetical protein
MGATTQWTAAQPMSIVNYFNSSLRQTVHNREFETLLEVFYGYRHSFGLLRLMGMLFAIGQRIAVHVVSSVNIAVSGIPQYQPDEGSNFTGILRAMKGVLGKLTLMRARTQRTKSALFQEAFQCW